MGRGQVRVGLERKLRGGFFAEEVRERRLDEE